MADPLSFLAAGGDDWTIIAAVVQRAREIYVERREKEFRALARLIASELSQIFA